ncbi:hypothetical protein EUTSA_v10001178mg, partial [Eutrema salsugineum]
MTRPLQKMLTKNPPTWATKQTEATDASDKYWGAILFEEINGKRQICGYKSGRFKDSEMHYHSTFKEILAMLQCKQKMVPHQQLLRWSEWFSKYDFESFYLKGAKNTLADMLSRNPPKEVHMMANASASSSSENQYYDFDANMPLEAHQLVDKRILHEHLQHRIFKYQSIILSKYGINCHFIAPMGIHPDHPFAHLYRIENTAIPEEVLCFLWYLCSVYTIGITFDIQWLYQYVNAVQNRRDCFSTFLAWFAPLIIWSRKLRKSAKATSLPFKKLKRQG